jgi:phosphodiesterase/alkaline phosphatase D-like protein
MKNFASFRIVILALVAGYMLKTTSADADVTFLGVAAGDATTNDVTVWTRAKDEANPQPTAINVQISQDPRSLRSHYIARRTAGSPTDFTVKSDLGGLEPGTVYYSGSKPRMPRSQAMLASSRPP